MPILTNIALYLRIAGTLLLLVAVAHVTLPRALGWSVELQGVSLMTRQVSYVHTYFIGLMCGLFGLAAVGLICLLTTAWPLRCLSVHWRCWAAGGFTALRLRLQLWRRNYLTVLGHLAFVVLWSYQTFVFAWALVHQL